MATPFFAKSNASCRPMPLAAPVIKAARGGQFDSAMWGVLAECRDQFHELFFTLEHRQMAALGNQFQSGTRNVLTIRFPIGGGNQLVAIAPNKKSGTGNAVQSTCQLRIVWPLPDQASK